MSARQNCSQLWFWSFPLIAVSVGGNSLVGRRNKRVELIYGSKEPLAVEMLGLDASS